MFLHSSVPGLRTFSQKNRKRKQARPEFGCWASGPLYLMQAFLSRSHALFPEMRLLPCSLVQTSSFYLCCSDWIFVLFFCIWSPCLTFWSSPQFSQSKSSALILPVCPCCLDLWMLLSLLLFSSTCSVTCLPSIMLFSRHFTLLLWLVSPMCLVLKHLSGLQRQVFSLWSYHLTQGLFCHHLIFPHGRKRVGREKGWVRPSLCFLMKGPTFNGWFKGILGLCILGGSCNKYLCIGTGVHRSRFA